MNRIFCLMLTCSLFGCGGNGIPAGEREPFVLAISEYPSWSLFLVAHEKGLIDKEPGKRGELEKKWNVDIHVKLADYDQCTTLYGQGLADATCITNIDILPPSLTRDSVAILPTSTSDGADACIVVGVDKLESLKGKSVYGLEKSVSQYVFERGLELKGFKPADFTFKQMDPAAASQAMQTKQSGIEAIMVWNPFLLQTLRTREDAKVLFDSTVVPKEVIDMVVVGKDVLVNEEGENFACCVVDIYYQMSKMLGTSLTSETPTLTEEQAKTLVALGSAFSNLGQADMQLVVRQTKFFENPERGIELFRSAQFRTDVMPKVVNFCSSHGMLAEKPKVGFEDSSSQLNFTTTFMEKVHRKK